METIEQMYNEAKALVEDRTYNIGEISEKTGLQKTANGWVKPSETKFGKVKQNKNGEWGVQRKQGKNSQFIKHKNESDAKNALANYTRGYYTTEKSKQDPHSEKARQIKHWDKETEKIRKENKAQQRAERAAQIIKGQNLKKKERDPKLMEELERSNRFEQEKMAKERQKKEDKIKQQRQEGEANARAFQEKVERGEIVYNKKSGQFEDKSNARKWKKTTDYQGRDRISLKTKQGGLVSIYETDNPNQKNNRFRVDTGTHTNTFNTLEEAKAFAEKHYGDTKENGPKENNAVKQWEESAKNDARRYKESMVIMQHPDGSVTAIRESSPDIERAEYNGYEKISLVHPDGSVKRKQETTDSACRITADTKIKLKNVVQDRIYQIGEISEKTGLQKTANGWVKPKKGTATKKEENKSASGKPSPELVAKRLARAEARKAQAKTTESTKTTTKLEWEPVKGVENMEIAKHNGNNIKLESSSSGYYWKVGTHSWYPTARGNAKTREEAIKQATEASKKNPGVISAEGIEWKRTPGGEYSTNDWTGADNGNIMSIAHNDFYNIYSYRVYEEGRDQQATFKTGEAKTLTEAMREAKKASDAHEHSGIRPIRIPYGAAFGNTTKWNNNDMYSSQPRNVKGSKKETKENESKFKITDLSPKLQKIVNETPELKSLLNKDTITIMKTNEGTILGDIDVKMAQKEGLKGKITTEPMSEYWAKELIEIYG